MFCSMEQMKFSWPKVCFQLGATKGAALSCLNKVLRGCSDHDMKSKLTRRRRDPIRGNIDKAISAISCLFLLPISSYYSIRLSDIEIIDYY